MKFKLIGGFDNIRKALNTLKQGKNWDEIFQEAVWEWASEIEDTAQQYLNDKVDNVTGKLKDSIYVVVDEDGDLAIKSRHRAAKIIDKGGESPFPSWTSPTIKEYAEYYGIEPFVLARGIFKNQPFKEATNFARNALFYHMDDIKDEIYHIARRRKDEAIASGTY